MKVFSIGVTIDATAYIKAESEAEALRIANEQLRNISLEVSPQDGELPISGRLYSDPRLPDISLSLAMSINEESYDEAMLDLAFDEEGSN